MATITGTSGNDNLVGTDASDVISAGAGNDRLEGLAGSDTLFGDAGQDTVIGGDGNDFLSSTSSANEGPDRFEGGGGDDEILAQHNGLAFGGDGADKLTWLPQSGGIATIVELHGDAGSDSFELRGVPIDGLIDGGDGVDRLQLPASSSLSSFTAPREITVDLAAGVFELRWKSTSNVAQVATVRVTSIENVQGTDGADLIVGNGDANFLDGLAGKDTLRGGGGDDILVFGAAVDVQIDGGDGFDVADTSRFAGTRSATIDLNTGEMTNRADGLRFATLVSIEGVMGLLGDDLIVGDSGPNLLNVSRSGRSSPNGKDTINGGAGDDTMGGADGSVIDGGEGNDTFVHKSISLMPGASSTITLKSIENLQSDGNSSSLAGDDGPNRITGLQGNDTLSGNGGNDTLVGGLGKDSLDGGAGDDLAVFEDPLDFYGITKSADGKSYIVTRLDNANEVDTLVNIERVQFADIEFELAGLVFGTPAADNLAGTANRDVVLAGDGNDVIDSGAGDDYLNGGSGADAMNGGRGNDIYVVDNSGDLVAESDNATGLNGDDGHLATLELGGNVDRVIASIAYTLTDFIEDLDLRSSASAGLKGKGNALANTIKGGLGHDSLEGAAGDDTLDGGSGNDRMEGGLGNDVYYVNATGDVVVETDNQTGSSITTDGLAALDVGGNTDRVVASIDYSLGDFVEDLQLVGASSLALKGNGNALANTITGSDGANELSGGAGNDRLSGGKGNDTLAGGDGFDTAIYSGARSAYSLSATGSNGFKVTHNSGADGVDSLTGIERIEFADGKLALDVNGKAGDAALLIGALMGKSALQSTATVGAVLGLLDGGQTLAGICELAVAAGFTASLAGGAGNDKFAALLVKNLLGVADAGTTNVVQGLLDSKTFTQGSLLAVACTLDINKANVDLVGLADSGLVYR